MVIYPRHVVPQFVEDALQAEWKTGIVLIDYDAEKGEGAINGRLSNSHSVRFDYLPHSPHIFIGENILQVPVLGTERSLDEMRLVRDGETLSNTARVRFYQMNEQGASLMAKNLAYCQKSLVFWKMKGQEEWKTAKP